MLSAKYLELHTYEARITFVLFMNVYLMPCALPKRVSAQKYLLNEWMECDRESTRD